jgi:hypothetical protein
MQAPEQRSPAVVTEATPAKAEQGEMPETEQACRRALRELGVTFVELEPLNDAVGCNVAWPVSVSRLPGNVELKPEATLTCAMAEATARFVTAHAAPIAQSTMKSDLAAIHQVSSHVCRPRTDGNKMSEHARANALDWGALEFADGTTVAVRAHPPSAKDAGKLIGALREAACGPFKTVLGPGSDADHADHFHFDLAQRRNGGTWCH